MFGFFQQASKSSLPVALVFSAVLALTYSQECFTPSDCPNLSRQSCIFGRCIGPRIKPQAVDHDLGPQGEESEAVPQGQAPKEAPFVPESAPEVEATETAPQDQDPVSQGEIGEQVQKSSESTTELLRARRSTK
ncbi:hypothetical protein AAVH_30311 [Aphelenchoides avenae]|nr:hypothetical protein AAVH_30311 [Aphelenchus avenae]